MSTRVVERVDGWEQRSFSGGYRGLQDLADAEFSGVVRAGGASLYVTKGTVVGIDGGSIEDFEGASGTSYRAPSPALPLLAVMQDRSDEVRAKYYTEETPISDVDGTLSDGGFTGYVELSENVLSGDYYLVYHQGRSMSVAFVGNSQQLVDGDEAFGTADDEVGIYEVRPVAVEAIEIPQPEPDPDPDPDPAADTGSSAEAAEPSTGGAVETADEGAGASGEPVVDGQDAEEERGQAAKSENLGSEPGDVGDTAEPDDRAPDADHAGTDRTDQPGAGAADPRSDAGTGPSPEASAAPGQDATVGAEQDSTDTDGAATEREGSGRAESAGGGDGRTPQQERDSGSDDSQRETAPEHEPDTGSRGQSGTDEPAPGRDQAPADDDPATAGAGGSRTAESKQSGSAQESASGPAQGGHLEAARQSPGATSAAGRTESTSEDDGVTLETRSVPSLDPERTSAGESGRGDTATPPSGVDRQTAGGAGQQPEQSAPPTSPPERESDPHHEQQPTQDRDPGQPTEPGPGGADPGDETTAVDSGAGQEAETGSGEVTQLREQLEDREAELGRLETGLAEETERREELEAEVANLREERDELAAEVERLETELERVEKEFGVATGAQQRLTAAEALEGTDLFVRYQSKNGTTLTDAHGGEGRPEDVTENLRLEQHTQFEADEVAVDGQDYGSFIPGRVEYQFVTWLVEDLLFEIRDTGGTDGLADIYDALPDVDRAELNGVIAVRYTEDGTEQRGQETFDIVLRDRMGNPLFVANLNDSRQGATDGMMEQLITAAERVGGSKDTLAGAFLVTESFFEPEALETAAEATKDGLLSRDKRKSFVNMSRKQGYHLCLVEARNQNFHLAVPEL